jgi:serine/threonine-protein kinase HipA
VKSIERLTVHLETTRDQRRRVGRLAIRAREILFEYDAEFIATGFDLSPFRLRLQSGVLKGKPDLFDGLPGLFEDSLPDGWGRLLLDRQLRRAGVSPSVLNPLDRLAHVGHHGMGALVYEPDIGVHEPSVVDLHQVAEMTKQELDTLDSDELQRLLLLGGSPAGARPKALVQVSEDRRSIIYGGDNIAPGYAAYLVKLPAKHDGRDVAAMEHAYATMAAAAGIHVPETCILGRTAKKRGYFATRRFDRRDETRVHVQTLAALLNVPHTTPSLTYEDLLGVTRELTRSEAYVEEMYRRVCFNVFARNRDDHAKNHAFLMDETGSWAPSPAYDLTFSFFRARG